MVLMVGELYEALRLAQVPDENARAAASVGADFERRIGRIETLVSVNTAVLAMNTDRRRRPALSVLLGTGGPPRVADRSRDFPLAARSGKNNARCEPLHNVVPGTGRIVVFALDPRLSREHPALPVSI